MEANKNPAAAEPQLGDCVIPQKPQTREGKQSLKVIVHKQGPDDVITVVTGINAIAAPLNPPLHTDFTAHFRLIQDYKLYNKVRMTAATTR